MPALFHSADHPLFFVKFFDVELYAQEFVKGRLFLQPLSAFKKMEEKDDCRGDRHEGSLLYMPRNQLGSVKFGPMTFHPEDLLDDLAVQPVDANPINVFCLYAPTAGRFFESGLTPDNIGEFLEHIRISPKCLDMGRHAVLIGKPAEFARRFFSVIKRDGFSAKSDLVKYYDPSKWSGPFKDPLFMKKNHFAWQREFRFVVNRSLHTSEAYRLDVGDISDLCVMAETKKFNEMLSVVPNDKVPSGVRR